MAKFYCKYCGASASSVSGLTNGSCRKSPNNHHQPYEGAESKKYTCKFCGSSASSISGLTNGSCRKSDNGHHQPL